jgi:hypothetical protein
LDALEGGELLVELAARSGVAERRFEAGLGDADG